MNRGTTATPPDSNRFPVRDGTVCTAPLAAIPVLLRELGQDPAAVFAESGIDPRLLEDREQAVPFASAGRLLAVCAERTGYVHFGLLLGQRTGVDCLGPVGMLAERSPDLATALRNLVLHLHLRDRGAIPTLSVGERDVRLGYVIYRPEVEGTTQVYDLALAISYNMLRALCGSSWQPEEVLLSHAKPADIGPYRRAFRARVRFDAEHSALVFPATWLAHPLPGADPQLYRTMEARIATLSGADGRDLAAQVRRVACNLMLHGEGSLEAVANVLSLHPRTLNRRLRQQGSSYRQLREDCQQAIAYQLLRDSELAVSDVAEILSYADVPAFTRAFRRWCGSTPAAWRTAQRAAHGSDKRAA